MLEAPGTTVGAAVVVVVGAGIVVVERAVGNDGAGLGEVVVLDAADCAEAGTARGARVADGMSKAPMTTATTTTRAPRSHRGPPDAGGSNGS